MQLKTVTFMQGVPFFFLSFFPHLIDAWFLPNLYIHLPPFLFFIPYATLGADNET